MTNPEDSVKDSSVELPKYIQMFTKVVNKCGMSAAYLYGVIHFFSVHTGKKFTMSNDTIARLLSNSPHRVSVMITELENAKMIRRVMKYGRRVEIVPLYATYDEENEENSDVRKTDTRYPKNGQVVSEKRTPLHTEEEKQNESVVNDEPSGSTPELFSEERLAAEKARIIGFFSLTESDADKVVLAFTEYWTAVNEGGKKQHWQKQKTFDLKLRLNAWVRSDIEKGRIKPRQKAKPVEVKPGMPGMVNGVFQKFPEGWIYDQMNGRLWENDGQSAQFNAARRSIRWEILPNEVNPSWSKV